MSPDPLEPEKDFLRRSLIPMTLTGGGLCAMVVTATVVQTLGPVVLVGAATAGGLAGYSYVRGRARPRP